MGNLSWLTDKQMERFKPLIGRTKGVLNTKPHAVTDAKGRPLKFFMTAGQVSDYTGAAALPGSPAAAEWMIADWRHDAIRYDRCAKTFLSAVALAATVTFWP